MELMHVLTGTFIIRLHITLLLILFLLSLQGNAMTDGHDDVAVDVAVAVDRNFLCDSMPLS